MFNRRWMLFVLLVTGASAFLKSPLGPCAPEPTPVGQWDAEAYCIMALAVINITNQHQGVAITPNHQTTECCIDELLKTFDPASLERLHRGLALSAQESQAHAVAQACLDEHH